MFEKEKKLAIVLTGNEKGQKLKEKLETFAGFPRSCILLTTLQKLSEGLNLTIANHIIILEFWWNLQKIFQAMSRIDRKDQKYSVYIHLLCYHDNGEIIKEENGILVKMENKVKEANEVYKKIYTNNSTVSDNNESQLRELPKRKYFYDAATLGNELPNYFREIRTSSFRDEVDYTEIEDGKPLSQTVDEIWNSWPITGWKIESFERMLQDLKKTRKWKVAK
jgi:hypothetical protein